LRNLIVRRCAWILLEIAGVAIGGVLVVAALASWRLTSPVETRFIRPYIEQAINSAGLGFSVQVAEARLDWHRFRPVLDLHVHGAKVLAPDGAPVAAFQDAKFGVSLRSLLIGRLVLSELDLQRPEIVIIRDATDHFSMRIGAPDNGAPTTDLSAVLGSLTGPPSDDNPLSRLGRLHVVDGRIVIDDQKLGIAWSAPNVDIDIGHTAEQTTAHIDVSLALPRRTAKIKGALLHVRARAQTAISLSIADFDAAAVAPLAKALAPLSVLAIPVEGELHAVLGATGNLLTGDAALHGADGKLVLPDLYPEPLSIKSIALKAHLENTPHRLTLERLEADFGDARAVLTGTAGFDGPAAAIDVKADLSDIPLARFDALWPHGVAVGGRDWVTQHIPAGIVKSGTAHLVATARTDDSDWLKSAAVDGTFDYVGLEVNFFPPLPPVRNVAGHASFDSRHMDLTIDSGVLGDIAVSQGALTINGFDADAQSIDIGLSIDGPLATALSVLDSPPLGFMHKLGIDPKTVGGHNAARLNFDFPLIKDLLSSQIVYAAKGNLVGVAVAQAVGPRDVTDGTLALTVNKAGMTLAGDARLSGVPLTVDWRESFADSSKVRSRIAFKGTVDDAGWTALKLDPSSFASLKGTAGVNGQVSIDRSRTTTLDVTADLASADLSVGVLGLRKPAGEAGSATASLAFVDGVLRRVPRIQIDSASAKLAGSAEFAADGSLTHAELPQVGGSRADYALVADAQPGAKRAYAISVKGARFDASGLMDQHGSDSSSAASPRLDLTLALDHVSTAPKRGIDAVAGSLTLTGGRLDSADLQATAGSGPLTLVYTPAGDTLDLHLAAQDAGATLAGLGITGGVRGGTLHLDGKTTGGDGARLTTGTLDMRDFRLVDAPIIARLVNALSPTGFVDLLSGQGLATDRLNSEVDYAGGKLVFRNGRSAGALGISFEGNIDFDADTVALKGTVVPADTLNRIIAAIPLIGDIVTGGSRGGLIGWTYTVGGKPDDPRVSVNPLSMFAPGFLRNLFFLGPSEPAPKAEEKPAAPAAPSTPAIPSASAAPAPAPAPEKR